MDDFNKGLTGAGHRPDRRRPGRDVAGGGGNRWLTMRGRPARV